MLKTLTSCEVHDIIQLKNGTQLHPHLLSSSEVCFA